MAFGVLFIPILLLKNTLNYNPCNRLYSKINSGIIFLQYPTKILGNKNVKERGMIDG
jgi:hypothetical protein